MKLALEEGWSGDYWHLEHVLEKWMEEMMLEELWHRARSTERSMTWSSQRSRKMDKGICTYIIQYWRYAAAKSREGSCMSRLTLLLQTHCPQTHCPFPEQRAPLSPNLRQAQRWTRWLADNISINDRKLKYMSTTINDIIEITTIIRKLKHVPLWLSNIWWLQAHTAYP